MKIKPMPADPPVTFGSLTAPQLDQTLEREAKQLNNKEKGYRSDEKYLGEQQTMAQKARKFAQTGEAPWDDYDPEDPINFDEWMG